MDFGQIVLLICALVKDLSDLSAHMMADVDGLHHLHSLNQMLIWMNKCTQSKLVQYSK